MTVSNIQILPLSLTLIGVAILCSLGLWQLDRLQWKQAMLEQIEQEYTKPDETLLIEASELDGVFAYKRARLVGEWDYQNQIHLGPRTYNHQIGYHIITPFNVLGGRTLLINRGWVPLDWPVAQDSAQGLSPAFVIGLIKKPPRPNAFTAANDAEKNQWVHLDVQDIAAAKSLTHEPYDYIMRLEHEVPAENVQAWAKPIAQATKPMLNNNHQQYAWFWFTMAGILIVIYGLRFHYKKN